MNTIQPNSYHYLPQRGKILSHIRNLATLQQFGPWPCIPFMITVYIVAVEENE